MVKAATPEICYTVAMKILTVGSGGREHAITWRLAQDEAKHELYCAPGNAGTAALATNLALGAEDVAGIAAWAAENTTPRGLYFL